MFGKNINPKDLLNNYKKILTIFAPIIPHLASECLIDIGCDQKLDWPSINKFPKDDTFMKNMDIVREICSAGLGIRKSNNIRVRQPLKELTVVGDDAKWIQDFENYVLEEVNIKKIHINSSSDSLYKNKIKINLRKLGPKLGKDTGKFMQAANNDEWKMNHDKTLSILDKTLSEDEYILEKESLPGTETRDIENGNIIVSLNIDIDNDLEIEGIARDILRAIQNKRKELDLDISDKINVNIFGNSKINETLESYNEYISSNSLAEKLIFDKNTKSEKIKISETNEIFLSINKS